MAARVNYSFHFSSERALVSHEMLSRANCTAPRTLANSKSKETVELVILARANFFSGQRENKILRTAQLFLYIVSIWLAKPNVLNHQHIVGRPSSSARSWRQTLRRCRRIKWGLFHYHGHGFLSGWRIFWSWSYTIFILTASQTQSEIILTYLTRPAFFQKDAGSEKLFCMMWEKERKEVLCPFHLQEQSGIKIFSPFCAPRTHRRRDKFKVEKFAIRSDIISREKHQLPGLKRRHEL